MQLSPLLPAPPCTHRARASHCKAEPSRIEIGSALVCGQHVPVNTTNQTIRPPLHAGMTACEQDHGAPRHQGPGRGHRLVRACTRVEGQNPTNVTRTCATLPRNRAVLSSRVTMAPRSTEAAKIHTPPPNRPRLFQQRVLTLSRLLFCQRISPSALMSGATGLAP